MFYELYDWDYNCNEKEDHLINLDEVILINRNNVPYSRRNDKTNKVEEYFRINVYYTGNGNSWTFYYKSVREQLIVYNNLKKALIEKGKIIKEMPEPNPLVDDVPTNVLDENKWHTLDDMLKNPPAIEPPEVKY